jgi:hypothetical protein
MSNIQCPDCGRVFDGELYPFCPTCLGANWAKVPDFIRLKHDPEQFPLPLTPFPRDRSVVSPEVRDALLTFTLSAAENGTWYYSNRHRAYCHATLMPLGTIPGSGVLAGASIPIIALDGLLIAKADSDAHAYAEDMEKLKNDVASGDLQPLPVCSAVSCNNLAQPGFATCSLHKSK